eukprot:CCRYP_020034-RB/>CCRYP_020034-RB protein AED:0.46 eAED:-0.11 QI:0/0/0/1/0/0/2/0/484
MFHGGTIFRDASSKYIHVQNQVSLGAGETVNAKIGFEEWLWEQSRLSVKHYHSDNGVFAAELFKDACKEEHQSQSFSGVGAKHQNAEAERAIQTVMYMARSLRQSGITPLEMITSTKSDHSDLLRSHVWGCPVYVLEPKLQDGKKLPKWNRHARMGQFLGFSRQHSSTVTLVCNLHTGYVSPQYHVVFNDNFQTVFHDGKSSEELDKICDQLFVESRDCYVEEEFDEDGILIYGPPPLDEVWLSEPERCEPKNELEKQREHTRRQQDDLNAIEIKRRMESSKSPLPDLVESDDESDSDSLSSNPVIESGGEMDHNGDSYWRDHPINEKDNPELPTFEQIDSPTKSTEEADTELGRSADGKSHRLRNLVSLGDKQLPPAVRHSFYLRKTSRKPISYRKRIADRRCKADALMLQAEIKVPSIEALMACPLSKFIHFAANDCGYTGSRYDLIANWVHPLFLKAKTEASKEDNPSWKQAMSGPFKEEY